jgi:hypothetical protein
VAHEDVVFDGDPFADEGMAGNLAVLPDGSVLLDLYEGPDLGIIPDGTAIEVDEFGELDIFSQFDVVGNA